MSKEELLENIEINEALENILVNVHREIDEMVTDCFVTALLVGFGKQ